MKRWTAYTISYNAHFTLYALKYNQIYTSSITQMKELISLHLPKYSMAEPGYNMMILIQNSYKTHFTAHPYGWDMASLFEFIV